MEALDEAETGHLFNSLVGTALYIPVVIAAMTGRVQFQDKAGR
jgi:hypothetical protein